jgi:Anti-sigma-K factor rskA
VPHCTPEQLALAALREPLPAGDAEHLATCDRCRAEVAALQRGVDAVAVPHLAAPGPGVAPPPDVWSAIAARTGVRAAPRPDRVAAAAHGPAPEPVAAVGGPPERPAPPAAPLPLRGRRPAGTTRPRWRLPLAVAAAAAVGAGVALGAVALARSAAAGTEVAGTSLQALGADGTAGTARVVEHRDHSRELDVRLRAARPGSGYYEVWLADPRLARMVAVGILQDGAGALELPAGLDIGSYPVVDVSVEPLDGDPAHSADSVARGVLR